MPEAIKLTGPHLARVHRKIVGEELVEVNLEMIQDSETVHLTEGDEFITFYSPVDPWAVKDA